MESWEQYALDFKYGCFKDIEPLKRDGSNFSHWFRSLRDVLEINNVMYVIENPLRFPPGPEASAQDRDDF